MEILLWYFFRATYYMLKFFRFCVFPIRKIQSVKITKLAIVSKKKLSNFYFIFEIEMILRKTSFRK